MSKYSPKLLDSDVMMMRAKRFALGTSYDVLAKEFTDNTGIMISNIGVEWALKGSTHKQGTHCNLPMVTENHPLVSQVIADTQMSIVSAILASMSVPATVAADPDVSYPEVPAYIPRLLGGCSQRKPAQPIKAKRARAPRKSKVMAAAA